MTVDLSNQVPKIVRTLLASGFVLDTVIPQPQYVVFKARRTDEFGVSWSYLIAFSGNAVLSPADVNMLERIARYDKASLIVVGSTQKTPTGTPVIAPDAFIARLGGKVPSYLPLEPEYTEQLSLLGHNSLPTGLVGKPDDLFEMYVQAGLEFLLQDRVIRYGQERRFKVVPDGLVLGRNSLLLLYDCKAYSGGYPIKRESLRQFADYALNFHHRYEHYIGRLHAFVVISGHFKSVNSLGERSAELFGLCQVPLVCLEAQTLGEMVSLLAARPVFRQAVNWRRVFSGEMVDIKAFKEQLEAIEQDGVIRLLPKDEE